MKLVEENRIHYPKNGGLPMRKYYLHESKGIPYQDVWERIVSKKFERTGYPTQKPIHLIKRMIEHSTNPGDIVLDPFCGSGSTIVRGIRL